MRRLSNSVCLKLRRMSTEQMVAQNMEATVFSLFPTLNDFKMPCLDSYISVRICFANLVVTCLDTELGRGQLLYEGIDEFHQ
jgi:hypothetical protein